MSLDYIMMRPVTDCDIFIRSLSRMKKYHSTLDDIDGEATSHSSQNGFEIVFGGNRECCFAPVLILFSPFTGPHLGFSLQYI
jgi:hypothetical protein